MSEDRSRSIRLQTARELEERGHVDKAVALYLKAGAPGEAARLLVSKERFRDAGQLMLDSLGVLPDDVGRLEGPPRNAAAKAARCFALSGDHATASRILRALGMADEAGGARPSMPPDVLPRTAPAPSLAPPAGASASSVPPAAGVRPAPTSPPAAGVRPAPTSPPAASVRAPSTTVDPRGAGPAAQSQAPISAMSPSAMPPSAMPPSATPPSAISPSALPPSAVPPSAAPPGAPPTAAVPSGVGPASRPSMAATGPKPAARPQEPGDKWGRAAGWKSGQVDESALDKAIAQLLEQGKPGQAARVAWDAGRLEDAARWFAEAGFDYETGAVLLELERFDAAIERLVRVPLDHKRHRAAGAKLVDAADRRDRFDFEIDRALARFVKAPPIEAAELPTYLRLADLYARHGFADGARGALEQILLFDPGHAGAQAALARIAPPAPAQRAEARAARPHAPAIPGSLPQLPPLAEFVALARQHAPARRPSAARG